MRLHLVVLRQDRRKDQLTDDTKLIESWIARYETIQDEGDESEKAESLFWTFEQLDDYCWRDPKKAMEIILGILSSTNNEFVLDNLAAGPLESLLSRHGETVIKDIELEAKSNSAFRNLLGGVWQNQMSDELWHRVLQAAE